MFPWTLAYKENQTELVRFALKVVICPLTRLYDLVVLIQPILDSIVPVPSSPIDKIFYVARMMSIHPQFAVIMVFDKSVLNSLLLGLADGVIFDVQLKPEHFFPDDVLLCIPDNIIDTEPVNAGKVIQALPEEVTGPIR